MIFILQAHTETIQNLFIRVVTKEGRLDMENYVKRK